MVKYECKLCNFSTEIKCQFVAHNQTQKHLSNVNVMEQEKDLVIQQKDMEIMKLKAQLEFAERIINGFQRGSASVLSNAETNEVSCFDCINDFKNSPLMVEPSDELLETETEKKEKMICDNIDNDTYMSKVALSELPYYNEYISYHEKINKPYNFAEIAYDILKDCSIDITDKYKNRFRLYKANNWLSIEDSRDILCDLIETIRNMFVNYHKLYCNIYRFDVVDKEINKLDQSIEQSFKGVSFQIRNIDIEEEMKHCLIMFNK